MAFSTGFGLTCMCFIMLLFLPGEGQHQCTKTEPQNERKIDIPCCTATTNGLINEAVDACYVQEKGYAGCQIYAYIFVTKSDKTWCVDPKARWLPARLKKLNKRGITCEPLGN